MVYMNGAFIGVSASVQTFSQANSRPPLPIIKYRIKKNNMTQQIQTLTKSNFENLEDDGFADFQELYDTDKELAAKFFRITKGRPERTIRLSFRAKHKWVESIYCEYLGINKNGTIYRNRKLLAEIVLNYKTRRVFVRDDGTLKRVSIKGFWHCRFAHKIPEWFTITYRDALRCIDGRLDFLADKGIGAMLPLSLTAIQKNKLYSLSKIVRHLYPNIPKRYAIAVLRPKKWNFDITPASYLERLNKLLGASQNPEYLFQVAGHTPDFEKDIFHVFATKCGLEKSILLDTLTMAGDLGHTVNLTWSAKRFDQEHRKLYEEVNYVLLQGRDRPLNIASRYREDPIPGLELIDTTGRLLTEANSMRNCVASYLKKIESGRCAIYHLDHNGEQLTIEVSSHGNHFHLAQIEAYNNTKASDKARQFVEDAISAVNAKKGQLVTSRIIEDDFDLPF